MRSTATHMLLGLLAVAAVACPPAHADVRLPSIFGENMVLQRGEAVPVWGWEVPGTEVTVSFHGQRKQATADARGYWKVALETMPAGGPFTMTVAGQDTVALSNVLVGEVWVASGQSNMEWPLRDTERGDKAIATAGDYPQVRLYEAVRRTAQTPQRDVAGHWTVSAPETVPAFSAIGYFFGRRIYEALGVPVGIVSTNWGGTPVEAWMPQEALTSSSEGQRLLRYWNEERSDISKNEAAGLYNGMIAPLIPYAIRGALWYQGESNVERAQQYRTLFPQMIESWRQKWGQGAFPFYFVQIAPYGGYDTAEAAAELRGAQLETLSVPNTGMVVTMDIGNPQDIHPRNKRDVAHRLARWALAKTYGREDVVYSGPLYESMDVEGDSIRLHFDHVDGGLRVQGDALTHFTIAGEDGPFREATATIEGETVVVHSSEVEKPVAVRYGWSNDAEPNLFNEAGLPASPFRTDHRPGVTEDQQVPGQ